MLVRISLRRGFSLKAVALCLGHRIRNRSQPVLDAGESRIGSVGTRKLDGGRTPSVKSDELPVAPESRWQVDFEWTINLRDRVNDHVLAAEELNR